jgi:hypothetical protein
VDVDRFFNETDYLRVAAIPGETDGETYAVRHHFKLAKKYGHVGITHFLRILLTFRINLFWVSFISSSAGHFEVVTKYQTRPVQRGARDILSWRPNLLCRL